MSYWSPAQSQGTEVDFVLRRGREYLALEVKHQSRMGSDLLTGLRAIADLRGLVRRIAVYRGRQVLRTEDGIDIWPFERLVEAVTAGTLWP